MATAAAQSSTKRQSKPKAPKPEKFIPPGATSTVTPGGIARLDPDATDESYGERLIALSLAVYHEVPKIRKAQLESLSRDAAIDYLKKHCAENQAAFHRLSALGYLAFSDGIQMGPEQTRVEWYELLDELLDCDEPFAASPGTPGRDKPESVPAAAAGEAAKVLERGVMLAIASIERHPDNRHPADVDIQARAASLAVDGQLQDCEVRQLSPGRYQMLSGETRMLACKSNGWSEVRCTVIECDDKEAARRVAIHNAQRKDLNPIEKAQLIERLCTNHGFTREQAGKDVCGLTSGASASNLVRLLKLPQVWQDRVASGDLPESFARLIVSVCHVPAALKELDKRFTSKDSWLREAFESRGSLEDAIDNILEETTRDLRGKDRWIGNRRKRIAIDKTTLEANREALQIVTVPLVNHSTGKSEEVEVATNLKLYDKHWDAAFAAANKKTAERETDKSSGGSSPKRELSKEEKAKRTKQQRELLELRIKSWRHCWLANLVADRLSFYDVMRFVGWCLLRIQQYPVSNYGNWPEMLKEAITAAGGKFKGHDATSDWRAFAMAGDEGAQSIRDSLAQFCKSVLLEVDRDRKHPWVPYDVMIDLATRYSIDLDAEWIKMQRPTPHPQLESFFAIFTSDQLQDLAKELGVNLVGRKTRGAMAAAFVSPEKLLALPKCLRLPAAKEATAKPRKKGA